jgi:hypothetical protein
VASLLAGRSPAFGRTASFYYYLDNREPLDLLAERRHLEIHPQMLEEIRSHREKDYAGAAIRGQHMQLGFLNHGLMISRDAFYGRNGMQEVWRRCCT